MLVVALEQLLDVAPRLRTDPDLVWPSGDPSATFLRICHPVANGAEWHDEIRNIPPVPAPIIRIDIDTDKIQRCRALPTVQNGIEADVFMMPSPIAEGKERPFFPYILMMVESGSGFILASELLTFETSPLDLWGHVPSRIVDQVHQADPRRRHSRRHRAMGRRLGLTTAHAFHENNARQFFRASPRGRTSIDPNFRRWEPPYNRYALAMG